MAVSGSTVEIMSAGLLTGSSQQTEQLLAGRIKTSGPTDLIFRVTAECALWTNVQTVGNAQSEAEATVKVWVTVDGNAVPVSSGDTVEPGKVVFCNRAYRLETVNFSDDNATIRQFLRTRTANAFNWMTLNVGSGVHDITVMASLELNASGSAYAKAAVGKRTLIVEPVKLANDVTL
jgi:hypothetical protein